MISYVESGFELELYAVHEYPYILWYLGEFLYGWLLSTLNRYDVGSVYVLCRMYVDFLFIHSFIHSFIHFCIHSFIHQLIYLFHL